MSADTDDEEEADDYPTFENEDQEFWQAKIARMRRSQYLALMNYDGD